MAISSNSPKTSTAQFLKICRHHMINTTIILIILLNKHIIKIKMLLRMTTITLMLWAAISTKVDSTTMRKSISQVPSLAPSIVTSKCILSMEINIMFL